MESRTQDVVLNMACKGSLGTDQQSQGGLKLYLERMKKSSKVQVSLLESDGCQLSMRIATGKDRTTELEDPFF